MKWIKQKITSRQAMLLTVLLGVGISLTGVLVIAASKHGGDAGWSLVFRQFYFLTAGLLIMTAMAVVPFTFWRKSAKYVSAGAMVLLVAVLFFGIRINGMRGWLSVWDFYWQPSELFKPFYALTLAGCAAAPSPAKKRMAWLWILSTTALILAEPDFGTATIYLGIGFVMLYLGNERKRMLALIGGAMLVLAAAVIWRHPYMMQRLAGYWNPSGDPLGSGWHVRLFQLAIASGGMWGTTMQDAYWSIYYLPLSYNDSAFASMVEILGIAGVLPVLAMLSLLFLILMGEARKRAMRVEGLFLAGAGFLFAGAALLHMAVNVTILPTTGIVMPLLGYGGSSAIGGFLLLGLALSAMRTKEG
ncbi:MAG: FtsW/RodA/SpoVE family cell cycle protein [Victivallaceae bacterium]|nr:FtsW/RodA/SpoVE family cell cycle protein [Victivallaceae bacterium]